MQLVDWRLAEATAARLVPPGPRLPLDQAVATVEQLRELAAEAEDHVRRHTGLARGDGAGGVAVVDRPGWIRNNIEGFADLVDPLLETAVGNRASAMGPIASAIGPRATGIEVGAMLAYLSSRVLGQFELFGPATADTAGRLTLVAPNIVSAEQSLGVDPRDFRLWVCLHEVTHRIQFAAAPWLREHVRGLLREYLEASDLEPAALLRRLRDAVGGAASSLRSADAPSLIELVQTPRQREVLDRVTGLMSLLEGHADVVMDGVGPQV